MTTAQVNAGRGHRLSGWPWPAVVAALSYVALVTVDVKLGPVPLKAVVTATAIAVWAVDARRRRVSRLP